METKSNKKKIPGVTISPFVELPPEHSEDFEVLSELRHIIDFVVEISQLPCITQMTTAHREKKNKDTLIRARAILNHVLDVYY